MARRVSIEKLRERLARSPDRPAFGRIKDIVNLVTIYGELGITIVDEGSIRTTHELYKYVPVMIFANIEDYFRRAIAWLIDNQSECRNRARQFKDVTFKIDEVLAFGSDSVSVGHFISHTMSLNNLDDINAAMTIVLGNDYWHVLRNACAYNERTQEFAMYIGQFNYSKLASLFDVRHKICHEPTTAVAITGDECFVWMIEAVTLIGNTDTIVNSLLIGGELEDEIFGRKQAE